MSDREQPDKKRSAETMDADHVFRFHCSPGVACFTRCCADVTIALTPYDVIRLKNALGISSDAFLEKYTMIIPRENRLIPLVHLKMNEQDKRCPLVTEKGCTAYEDRPRPCRMYPLNMEDDGTFRVIADPSRCEGLKEEETWQISEWLVDQGVVPYDEMNTPATGSLPWMLTCRIHLRKFPGSSKRFVKAMTASAPFAREDKTPFFANGAHALPTVW